MPRFQILEGDGLVSPPMKQHEKEAIAPRVQSVVKPRVDVSIQPAVQTSDARLYKASAFDVIHKLRCDSKIDCIITDPPYWTLNKWREIGTTTRLGGALKAENRDERKWFETIDVSDLWEMLCEFSLLLPKNGHAWIFADNEVQSIIQGMVREGETEFGYVKSYPVLKLRGDGQAPRMGMGYHLKATHEYVVLCEKGRRSWSKELNNRPDYFATPWTSDAESRKYTPDGKPYPTAKPVSILQQLVELSSLEGETIFEPFAGSGATIEAALRLGRKVIACDISETAIRTCTNRITHLSKVQGETPALCDSGNDDGGLVGDRQPTFDGWM